MDGISRNQGRHGQTDDNRGNEKGSDRGGRRCVDTRRGKNKYVFELEIFVKKGDEKPIEDEDGVIVDNYAVRLTPEDEACEGFLIENATVSVTESWSSADGKLWKYTFDAKKPETGKTLKPYTKSA